MVSFLFSSAPNKRGEEKIWICLECIGMYCIGLYCIVLNWIVLVCIVLYWLVVYWVVLYCIELDVAWIELDWAIHSSDSTHPIDSMYCTQSIN